MSGSHGNDQSLQWKIGPGGVGGASRILRPAMVIIHP